MRLAALITLVLFCQLSVATYLRAAEPAACKECRDFQRACLQAHSKASCKTDYDICMKHCRQK